MLFNQETLLCIFWTNYMINQYGLLILVKIFVYWILYYCLIEHSPKWNIKKVLQIKIFTLVIIFLDVEEIIICGREIGYSLSWILTNESNIRVMLIPILHEETAMWL
jgi:hypothetical protein